MAVLSAGLIALSSFSLRGITYIFLRWIPGHQLWPIIFACGFVYFVTFAFTIPATSNSPVLVKKNADVAIPAASSLEEPLKNGSAIGKVTLVNKEQKSGKSNTTLYAEKAVWTRRDPHIARTLLLGLPSPTDKLWSFVTAGINFALIAMVADLVFRAPMYYQSHDLSFARIGFVSDTYAKLLIRETDLSQLPIFVSYRTFSDSTELVSEHSNSGSDWNSAGSVYWLTNETDYTHAHIIRNLRPSTQYQYYISNNHTGFFATSPLAGQHAPGTDKFTFLTSSCIKPHFPYNPLAHPLSIPGFRHVAKWLPSLQASFMLFLGDFIYIDVPHRFGVSPETYRREYRQVYSSPDWSSVSSIPWLHVLDDHEIANDWDRNVTAPYYPSAIDAFNLYAASVNPPPAVPNATYYTFTHGPASFFLLDTRTYRTPGSPLPATSAQKSMLGPTQLTSLLTYLRNPTPSGVKWKIIISSIPFTRNWRFNSLDTWANYLHERQLILEAMWSLALTPWGVGVIILSGDRHEFAATAFPPPKDGPWPLSATVHEFSTSPLSMFYLPVRTYWEEKGEEGDVCVKYVPDGNSKFGAVEIRNEMGGQQSSARFRLFVDGMETWSYVLTTPSAVAGRGGARM